jgi:hypothetical protein
MTETLEHAPSQLSDSEVINRFRGPSRPQPQNLFEKYQVRLLGAMRKLVEDGKGETDPIFITDIQTGAVCDISARYASKFIAELSHRLATPKEIEKFKAEQSVRSDECRRKERENRELEGKASLDLGPLVALMREQMQRGDMTTSQLMDLLKQHHAPEAPVSPSQASASPVKPPVTGQAQRGEKEKV